MLLSVVSGLVEEAKKQGHVKAITVEVGELLSLTNEQVRSLIKKIVPWDVIVLPKRALVQCVCGYYGGPTIVEKTPEKTAILCPSCGSTPGIISGDEIVLKNVVL
jgi:Zn finger protein HypA/HybF involved in hydrogenase expression